MENCTSDVKCPHQNQLLFYDCDCDKINNVRKPLYNIDCILSHHNQMSFFDCDNCKKNGKNLKCTEPPHLSDIEIFNCSTCGPRKFIAYLIIHSFSTYYYIFQTVIKIIITTTTT